MLQLETKDTYPHTAMMNMGEKKSFFFSLTAICGKTINPSTLHALPYRSNNEKV
jgi:hypothetical protein